MDQFLHFNLQDKDEWQVDITHLGTLYVINKNRNGKFVLEELLEFRQLYLQQMISNTMLDFQVEGLSFTICSRQTSELSVRGSCGMQFLNPEEWTLLWNGAGV